ncbi:MAG: hypothetical protein ACFHHU_00430 [Porticoccaceae bacterium]
MNDLIPTEETISRMESFQSFQTGEYWRALEAIPHEGIDAGEVLLIESIMDVDEKAHEVRLRAHPSKYDKSAYLPYVDNEGNTVSRHKTFRQHCFLVKDFLLRFEFAHDAAEVRARELKGAQDNINRTQQKLLDAQCDPSIVDAYVAERMQSSEQPNADVATSPALPVALPGPVPSLGSAIARGIDEQAIERLRADAKTQQKVAIIKGQLIQSLTQDVADAVQAMTPYYTEQAAAAVASTEDSRRFVDRLMDGIANLDLYTGKEVIVTKVAEGKSAPRTERLTLTQSRLFVDEEAAVFLEVDEWFDFRNRDRFFDLLRSNDAFARQLFPTDRCVLLMAFRRHGLDYGDMHTNVVLNQLNRDTFLLVRDGENIFHVQSPIESHLNSDYLFPSKDEFGRNFRGIDGSNLTLSDLGYADAVVRQKRFEMHYKRFLILLCGLDHRLGLFGSFYDGEPSFDFVSAKFQDEHFNFIRDKDGEGMLPATKVEPAGNWASRMNGYLRPGSRIIANWPDFMTVETAPSAVYEFYNGRGTTSEFRYYPIEPLSVLVLQEDKKGLYVKVPVRGDTAEYKEREFGCRVSLDRHILEMTVSVQGFRWLCLDMVKVSDLDTYIHHRPSRQNYINYIKLVKTARAHIAECTDAERATRSWLADAANVVKLVKPEEVADLVQTTVSVWRSQFNGAPLPKRSDPSVKRQVWDKLLDLMHMIAKNTEEDVARVEQLAQSLGYAPLRFAVAGNGHMYVYCAPKPDEMDNRFKPHEHVHRLKIRYGKTKIRLVSQQWAMLREFNAVEHVLHDWPTAKDWCKEETVFDHPDQKTLLLGRLGDWQDTMHLMEGKDPTAWDALVLRWLEERDKLSKGTVASPVCYVPFGLVHSSSRGDDICVASLLCRNIGKFFYDHAPDDERKARFLHVYGLPYLHSEARRRDLQESSTPASWMIVLNRLDSNFTGRSWQPFREDLFGVRNDDLRTSATEPLLTEAWSRFTHSLKDGSIVWTAGELDLDTCTHTKVPDDFHIHSVCWISLGDFRTNRPVEKVALLLDGDVSLSAREISDIYGFEGQISATTTTYGTHKSALEALQFSDYAPSDTVPLADGSNGQRWIEKDTK